FPNVAGSIPKSKKIRNEAGVSAQKDETAEKLEFDSALAEISQFEQELARVATAVNKTKDTLSRTRVAMASGKARLSKLSELITRIQGLPPWPELPRMNALAEALEKHLHFQREHARTDILERLRESCKPMGFNLSSLT